MEKHQKIALWIFGIVGFCGLTLVAIWLSGFLFVTYNKISGINTNIFLIWWEYWSAYRFDPTIKKQLMISALLSFGGCYGVPVAIIIAASQPKRSLHGDARFASASEIKKTGLLDETNGILVGKYKGQYLTFGGQQFVMLAAPTRSGKGVGVVIPNLLNFKDSVVVLDIKQENFNVTAGFREKHGQKIFLFNPFAEDYRTSRYNPLDYVRDDYRIADLMAIASVLYPSCGKDAFWDDHANNLFVGIGLYIFETPGMTRTIGEMLRQSSGKAKPFDQYIKESIYKRNFERKVETDEEGHRKKIYAPKQENECDLPPLSSQCIDLIMRFLSTPDNTRGGILASFHAPLNIWTNPIVDASTSQSDFDLRDVRKQRMSIYIGITPNYLHSSRRLVNLLFSQLINLNTQELPEKDPSNRHQCLLIMDEFTSIGRVAIIAQAVAYMAGYNLRILTIVQSPSQLEAEPPQGYGREGAQTLQTNHALRILYAPREQKDADEYSKMLGDETVKGKSTSKQKGKMGKGGGGSETTSDQKRALLLPQEIKEIGVWKEIITLENVKPILCDKIKYFEDENFKKRLLPPPEPPLLNLDLHIAKTEKRIRELSLEDCKNGVELDVLVNPIPELNLSSLNMNDTAQVNAVIDNIFNNLGFIKEEEEV